MAGAPESKIKEPQTQETTEDKPKFNKRKGLLGRLGFRKNPTVKTLLNEAFRPPSDPKDLTPWKKLDEANSLFGELKPKQQARAMKYAQTVLRSIGSYPFASKENTHKVAVLASFFEKAAAYLPEDKHGDKINAPYQSAIKTMAHVAETERAPETGVVTDVMLFARVACTGALWEMEYDNAAFWLRQITNPLTSNIAIGKLLEHDQDVQFFEHGWSILMKKLDSAGVAIAQHRSEKKVDFLTCMLFRAEEILEEIDALAEENPQIKKVQHVKEACDLFKSEKAAIGALRAALCLEPLPGDFVDFACERAQTGNTEELRNTAKEFIEILDLKRQLKCPDERKFSAAISLINSYGKKKLYLQPLLKRVLHDMTAEAQRPSCESEENLHKHCANYVLARLGQVGIVMQGQKSDMQNAVDGLLNLPSREGWQFLRANLSNAGPCIASSKVAGKYVFLKHMAEDEDTSVVRNVFKAAEKMDSVPGPLIDLAYDILDNSKSNGLDGTINAFLETAYKNRSQSADTAQKRNSVIRDLQKMFSSESSHKRFHALRGAAFLEETPDDFIEPAFEILGNSDERLAGVADFFLNMTCAKLGKAASESGGETAEEVKAENESIGKATEKITAIKEMIQSDNPYKVQKGLVAAIYFEDNQTEEEDTREVFNTLAADILFDDDREELHQMADDYDRIMRLKAQLDQVDEQYEAASEIMDLHASGKTYLFPMLMDIGWEMFEIVKEEPAKEDESALIRYREQEQCARYTLLKLTYHGLMISGPGLNVDLPDVVTEMLEFPTSLGWKMLRRDFMQVHPRIIESKSDGKISFLMGLAQSEQKEYAMAAFEAASFIDPIPQDFVDFAFELLDNPEKEELWGLAHNFLDLFYINLANSDHPEKGETLVDLFGTLHPQKVRHALRAAVYLESNDEFIEFARTMISSEKAQALANEAEEFLRVVDIREEFAQNPRIDTLTELVTLFASDPSLEKAYLCPALQIVANDMGDLVLGAETTEKEQQFAVHALHLLSAVGIISSDIGPGFLEQLQELVDGLGGEENAE